MKTLVVPQMVPVVLSNAEVRGAKRLAGQQQRRDRQAGIVDRAFYTGGDIAFEGILGQEAVGKYLGIKPDRTTYVRRGGADMRYRGIPLDVKSYPGRISPVWTVAGHKQAKDGVVFVFVCVRIPEPLDSARVWLAGWLDFDGIQKHRIRNAINNPKARSKWCYRVRFEALFPIQDLKPTLEAV